MQNEWQEYVVNGLEMRRMAVSWATTAVTTAGNSNGFHLESTYGSIRHGAVGIRQEEGRNGGKKERSKGLNRTHVFLFASPSVATNRTTYTYKPNHGEEWSSLAKYQS